MEGNWRKSSYSQGGDANCVELRWDKQGLLTRDSKHPAGGTLAFAGRSARAFFAAVKVGAFDS